MSQQLSLFPEENDKEIKDAEWCFQFFDNEPVVFGFTKDKETPSNLVIELRPTESDTLTFQQNGMLFKIFAREMSEESKRLREQQKQQNADLV